MFKFHDSNISKRFNKPNITAITDTYNGYQFNVLADTQVVVSDATSAKLGDMYVMLNIIDKPEIINTDDFKIESGEKIRAFRIKDFVGQQVDMSADLLYFTNAGTAQVETLTVLGTIGVAGVGNAKVIVTASGMANSPKTISVAVANDDTASLVAGKIRTALIADADIGAVSTGFFTVTGTDANIILTANIANTNDVTMNISVDNDTCTGLTAVTNSTNTTAGRIPATTTATMWQNLEVGDLIVSRTTADTDYPMKWQKVSSITGYKHYLKVIKKTAFGSFTVDAEGGIVAGGLLCEII